MKTCLVAVGLFLACILPSSAHEVWLNSAIEVSRNISLSFEGMHDQLNAVARQMMLQQFYTEERVRTEGGSGIKQIRNRKLGTKNYHSATHTGPSVAAIHEHANNIRTVGMGELDVVMNGVEFRTRHNDYRLYMPHRTSDGYHHKENIPFPDVPPEVTEKTDIDEQIVEMREWFKAFRDQNDTVRNYTKYFKPILCYLEGGWTRSGKSFEEGVASDRHFTDAKSWHELQMKNIFSSASGAKSRFENLAFLPTTVTGFEENIPKFAQWNYRIMCHPLKKELPRNRLRVVEDLSARMQNDRSIFQHLHSRAARFQVNPKDEETWSERATSYTLLDELMEEIPGVDNYQGYINGTDLDGNVILGMDDKVKDMSRYHRWYRVGGKDAMGQTNILRSFSDPYMFAAMTKQKKVADVSIDKCKWRKCETIEQRWTYAIPLEIIYLTPLSNWNPYNIVYKGDNKKSNGYKSVSANGRNGQCRDDHSKDYDGSHSRLYYRTPSEFYSGSEINRDAADTSRDSVCALDKDGNSRKVRSTGTRIFIPYIHGVGVLRQRYPIMPIHGESHPAWKEINALRDYVMNPDSHKKFSWHASVETTDDHEFKTGWSHVSSLPRHFHRITLSSDEYRQVRGGVTLTKTTSTDEGHEHTLQLRWNQKFDLMYYHRCDNNKYKCWDRHDKNCADAAEHESNST